MDQQEDAMDFKSLRAKFQEEDLFMKQPRTRPVLPEKPKVVPPPQSPTHYLPAGARPSLLTSINHTLDGKNMYAPRVVFKEDTKESKQPLIQNNSKGKEKNEAKPKGGKDKPAKASKEKLKDNGPAQKEKKENGKDKKRQQKGATVDLVAASPPPKAPTQKKKGIFGFRKSTKPDPVVIPSDPILDAPSPDDPGPTPLIPLMPSNVGDTPDISEPRANQAEVLQRKAILPNITLPDPTAVEEAAPPSPIPEPPDFSPPPAVIPDIPVPIVPTPQIETPAEIEACWNPGNPDFPVSRPDSRNGNAPNPPRSSPTPPTSSAIPDPPPVASAPSPSPPEPEVAEADIEAVIAAAVEKPPSPPMDPPSGVTSSGAERPISALSALERAEDMMPGKRTPPGDQRILDALEKARKKSASPLSNPTRSYSITPPPLEDLSPPQSPTQDLPYLPPVDYEAGNAPPLKPAPVNGAEHRPGSPVLEPTTEEGDEAVPELLVVPPPSRAQPDLECTPDAPEKPDRPPSADLREFLPPTLSEVIPVPPGFSEEFDDVASDAYCSELPVSEWGSEEYGGTHTPDEQDGADFYINDVTHPGADIHSEPAYETEYREDLFPEPSPSVPEDPPPAEESKPENHNSVGEVAENMHNDVGKSPSKKKGKSENGKKRKGTPKNPYAAAETPQETTQEKTKTGRFGRSEKKAAAEGPDEKELKKKEKQRLEKEKKELKERQEREKKEQKEREKKENEMKKKFKITGQDDAMYQAKVTVTTKGRKNDLPVNSGDIISIIRTTNCPKGKWLARDGSNTYGYVAVDHVELDIKEMLELGKKAGRRSTNTLPEAEVTSTGSRNSNQFPQSTESFSDDSEEWTCDDDEPLSPSEAADSLPPMGHARTLSMPDMGNKDLPVNHQHSHSDLTDDNPHIQARYEALQKLATFFHSPQPLDAAVSPEPETSSTADPEPGTEGGVDLAPEDCSALETDFDPAALILPPPDLYADVTLD
ncbi:FYN-binding protein 1 isoform X2 [Cololabis saira]|uniref:FYN-binding protein 1 isoform X2 n=1 Tax=Cololabis saira TaxID=129043 RepID=UPI002AD32CAC|nr:FYN-binding protein 1 isoform X2 [Cololabis saira]